MAARGLANVHLPGRVEPQQVPAILAQAQALLVTLVDDPAMALTVPSKVQTYLAAGRPIIAALAGEGARVVQQAGAGLACAAGSATALVDAVRRLHAMPAAERERMGEAGRRYHAEHFSPQRLTPALVAHLETAVQAHRSGRRQ